jgi:hypothetical protein
VNGCSYPSLVNWSSISFPSIPSRTGTHIALDQFWCDLVVAQSFNRSLIIWENVMFLLLKFLYWFTIMQDLMAYTSVWSAKVKSYLTTNTQSASLSWFQATIRTRDKFSFLHESVVTQLRLCYFMAPSLTRGRVCILLLLLGFAIEVPLESESRGTQDHILLSQFCRLPQPGGPGPRIHIPQGQGGRGRSVSVEFSPMLTSSLREDHKMITIIGLKQIT